MTSPSEKASMMSATERSPWRDVITSGHLSLGDALIAERIARLCGEPASSAAALALALTVRAVREGSTALDLAQAATSEPERQDEASAEPHADTELSPARRLCDVRQVPSSDDWLHSVAASALARQGVLRVDLGLVYLDRYYSAEVSVTQRLLSRVDAVVPSFAAAATADRDVPEPSPPATQVPLNAEQEAAVASVLEHATTVLTGGPGMGKTHTIGGVIRAVQAAAGPDVRIALAAPTGKAATRMSESLTEQGIHLQQPASTLHRLLGSRFGVKQRFRHDARNPLPHDLVIVDEASMISLSMMARFLEALPDTTRLMLVGDPDQLASVEAGYVLRDVVDGLGARRGVIHLVQEFRLASRRADLARAFRRGDADAVLALVSASKTAAADSLGDEVRFIETDNPDITDLPHVLSTAEQLREQALAGERAAALKTLATSRLLCAHRSGPWGTRRWNRRVEQALAERWPDIAHHTMYLGRPLLVTRNESALGVTNGDSGVILRDGDTLTVAFTDDAAGQKDISPWRLPDVETMHAMTIHKAQGSQAAHVTVIIPPLGSRLLTREMLYTAVTRAQETLTLVGSLEAIRAAVEAPAQRYSGLARRLRQGNYQASDDDDENETPR